MKHLTLEQQYAALGALHDSVTIIPDPELTALRARIAKLEAALTKYGDDYCEGMYYTYDPHEEFDCGGCAAKLALKP